MQWTGGNRHAQNESCHDHRPFCCFSPGFCGAYARRCEAAGEKAPYRSTEELNEKYFAKLLARAAAGSKITLLGRGKPMEWRETYDGISIRVSADGLGPYASTFKMQTPQSRGVADLATQCASQWRKFSTGLSASRRILARMPRPRSSPRWSGTVAGRPSGWRKNLWLPLWRTWTKPSDSR